MKEWILQSARYFLSNWESLLVGGVLVVSVVIFLMGFIKLAAANNIKSKLLRKVILAWSSVLVALPVTAGITVLYGYDWTYFWAIYAFNAGGTIFVYWFYENTALRDGLAWLGKKTVLKFLGAGAAPQDLSLVRNELSQEAKALIETNTKSASKYKDDDLKKL